MYINAETNGIDSDDDKEDEGYSSDQGTNLLSKTWSKEEREKQKTNDEHHDNNIGNSKKSDKRKKGGQKENDSSSQKKLFGSLTISDSLRRNGRRTRGEWQSVSGEE